MSILGRRFTFPRSVQNVRDIYAQNFEEIYKFENVEPTPDILERFNDTLHTVLQKHTGLVERMAEGFMELRDLGIDLGPMHNIAYFLDRFYINRISLRMLLLQHLTLFSTELPQKPGHVGIIDPICDVKSVILDAYENARFLCESLYLGAPKIDITTYNSVNKGGFVSMVSIPTHLYHINFELLKNAMRATVEYHSRATDFPDIKISDLGGGVPSTEVPKLFDYMYTTAPPPVSDGTQSAMAGYGFGLPLSRLYARYFNGDLILVSVEGYGSDAYIYLKAAPSEANEFLPIYGSSSRRTLSRGRYTTDWSGDVPSKRTKNEHHGRVNQKIDVIVPPVDKWNSSETAFSKEPIKHFLDNTIKKNGARLAK